MSALGTVESHPMQENGALDRPCYSMKLMQPFVEVLRESTAAASVSVFENQVYDPDERVPIAVVHDFLAAAIEFTKDADLGLKAAQRVCFGDVGALDYLVCSGTTIEAALQVAARYTRLVNDSLDIRLEVQGDRAIVRFENRLVLPRAATDFQLGCFFVNYFRAWFKERRSEIEVSFMHDEPVDSAEYARTFAPARVVFSAAFDGFSFDRERLGTCLHSADSRLHGVIQKLAEQMLAALPRVQSTTVDVRRLLTEELATGNPGATHIARRLGLSTRTLGRKLEREGTTFKDLLDETRKQLALQYVGGHDFSLSEVAVLLGFSQTAAFHRAFRRWTGQTPLQYRRRRLR